MKKIALIVSICMIMSILAVSVYASDSNQIYIYNTSAESVKMTASLYGYTHDGSYIRIGDAILRTDYRSGYTPTFNTLDVIVFLYYNYEGPNAMGTPIDVSGNEEAEVGSVISTGQEVMNSTHNAQNIAGYYRMITPDGLTIISTLGIVLENDGTLVQDPVMTDTLAF